MIPSLLSHSLSSITRLVSTMDFYWFCLILAPPWETPWPCHIFCSGFIHHSMRPSIQPDLCIMTLAILITFLMFNNQTGLKLKISIFFASIVHPPWVTPRPCNINFFVWLVSSSITLMVYSNNWNIRHFFSFFFNIFEGCLGYPCRRGFLRILGVLMCAPSALLALTPPLVSTEAN